MATPGEHRTWASENEALANHLGGSRATRWIGWVITLRFYSALHEAQAFLIEHTNTAPGNHPDRNRALTHWPDISDPYNRLYRWSKHARYDNHFPDPRLNESLLLLAKVRLAIEEATDARGNNGNT